MGINTLKTPEIFLDPGIYPDFKQAFYRVMEGHGENSLQRFALYINIYVRYK